MPIECSHNSDQFCGVFESAAGGFIADSAAPVVSLLELLGVQLASFSKQIDIGGTEIVLHIAPAIYLATLINELAVNAVRRGALSLCSGRVSLQWSIDEQSDPAALRLRWEETGRPVSSPERTEFSRANIEALREISRTSAPIIHEAYSRAK